MDESLDATTLPPPPGRSLARRRRTLPALTVLAHPDPRRIGDMVLLRRPEQLLSRKEPPFASPQGGQPKPLADLCLSAKLPILLRYEGGKVCIEAPPSLDVRIAGNACSNMVVTPKDLDDGVTIELADRVGLLLHYALEGVDEGATNAAMERTAEGSDDLGLIGASDGIVAVRQRIRQLAPLKIPVLVRGETGSGKELVAEAIAKQSRRSGPLVVMNMAAVTPTLAAAALFGNTHNAWNGAVAQPGYFGRANLGTVFLDEVGVTPHDVQNMLLRVLDSGEIQPVGDNRVRFVDVRLIAATDADLESKVASGHFLEPLYHRLAGFEIYLPPLRERREDIARLLLHFLRQDLAAQGEASRLEPRGGSEPGYLPASLVATLVRYHWPGNVRELRNAARKIAVASLNEKQAVLDEALAKILGDGGRARARGDGGREADAQPLTEEVLMEALDRHRWNVTRVASELKRSRTTVYKYMEAHGLQTVAMLSDAELEAAREACGGDVELVAKHLRVTSLPGLQLRVRQLERKR